MKKIFGLIKNNQERFVIPYVLFLSFPAVLSLARPGFFGASDELHISWLYEMFKLFKIGQIPPRFVPDLSFGFGYPLFNFVFPLPFYIGSAFHALGFSLIASVKLVFLISIPASMYFMYKLLRQFVSRELSLLGGVIYAYTPYRSTDIYVRGAIGEAFSFIFLPLVLLCLVKLGKSEINTKNKLFWIAILSLAISFLVLSHNIVSYMFMPFVAIFAALLFFRNKTNPIKLLLNFSGAVFLGLSISLYFWLPAIIDSNLMQYSTVFNYYDHFPTIRQLLTPYFGYGASVPGPYDGLSFFIGLSNLLLIPVSIYGFFRLAKKDLESKIILIFAILSLLISIFMMNFRSDFLWKFVPNLAYFQFPWRFLTITTFATSLLVVGLKNIPTKKYVIYMLIVGVIIINFNYFKPHDYFSYSDSYYLSKYIPMESTLDVYKNNTEEYLRLSKWTKKRPVTLFPRLFSDDPVKIKIISDDGLNLNARVESEEDFTININKYWFPGWAAIVNGDPYVLIPGDPYGQLQLELPKGTNYINVYFKETPLKSTLDMVSLLSFLASLVLILRYYEKSTK